MDHVICTHKPSKDVEGERTVRRLGRWAELNEVELIAIPCGHEKTPDYNAEFPCGMNVIIEVKEICIPFESVRDDDGSIYNRILHEPTADLKDIAKPLRTKIRSANKQLRWYSAGGTPTLTLIGTWNPCIERAVIDPISIRFAITGDNRIQLNGTPFILQGQSGGRELGSNMNTSTSGLGVFDRRDEEGRESTISVFDHENPKVRIPRGLAGFVYQELWN